MISTDIRVGSTVINIFNSELKYEDTNALNLKSDTDTPLSNSKNLNMNRNKYGLVGLLLDLYLGVIGLMLLFMFLGGIYIILLLIWNFANNFFDSLMAFTAIRSGNIIKLRKVKSNQTWEEITFNINNKLFSKELFEKLFNKFWNSIEDKFTKDNHLFILLKIKYTNNEFVTIGKLQRINKSDKNWYLDFVFHNMDFKSEYYNETQIDSFIFSYGFKIGKIENKDNLNIEVVYQNYKVHKLPISMEPKDYGRLIIINKIDLGVNYILQNEKGETINFRKFDNYNEIEFFKSGISLIKFTDVFISKSIFLRNIYNKKFWFKNGTQILSTSEIKTKFITKKTKIKNIVNKFITLDIETFVSNNTLVPYLICFYDGKNIYSFGLWDYKNPEMMILDCLKSIFIRKYNGYSIYIHNMAKFDIIFLLKYLVKIVFVQPIIHNGRIISLTINFGENNKYKIEIKDSYLLLLASLAKLTTGFGVKNVKSIFPHFFVNENNLDYVGTAPDIKYFTEVSKKDYNEYKSNFYNSNWNLRKEAIKYCEIDCISLYQVIYKFNDLIFEHFSKNIHHYPTLPSLAFAIFRSNFMENENIPQISGKVASDIRTGYTGGAVDVYIPKPPKGVKVKGYDVNSLYPAQMFDRLMPIGFPTFFEGNIRAINPNAFGFFYCNITAPDNIKHPIIQTHVKINNMTRTIAPIGSWKDMLFSMEMDNAIKYGYTFEILWGYTFESSNIFKDYVEYLFNLRSIYPRSNPLNYIAKILMNSLYGRFGMDDNFLEINVIHKDYLSDFENKFLDLMVDKIELGKHILIFFHKLDNSNEDNLTPNISIPIAAAITAYARIHMTIFKNNPKINLYYTDTDSAYTDSDIDKELISDSILGKLKLEHICNKAIFLAPKMYYLETEDGKIIYKVKGLSHDIKLNKNEFENLLFKQSFLEKFQSKWRKFLNKGYIEILEQIYTLKITENKRKLIYNENGKLISTKPYIINEDKEIINK